MKMKYIKAGDMMNSINIGNAGEYFVAGELERRGFTVGVPMSNVKDYDLNVLREDIGLVCSVASEKYVVFSFLFVVAQTCSPLSVRVIMLAVFQVLYVSLGQSVVYIAAYLPVHQIL